MAVSCLRHFKGSATCKGKFKMGSLVSNVFDILAHTYNFSVTSSVSVCFSLFAMMYMNIYVIRFINLRGKKKCTSFTKSFLPSF